MLNITILILRLYMINSSVDLSNENLPFSFKIFVSLLKSCVHILRYFFSYSRRKVHTREFGLKKQECSLYTFWVKVNFLLQRKILTNVYEFFIVSKTLHFNKNGYTWDCFYFFTTFKIYGKYRSRTEQIYAQSSPCPSSFRRMRGRPHQYNRRAQLYDNQQIRNHHRKWATQAWSSWIFITCLSFCLWSDSMYLGWRWRSSWCRDCRSDRTTCSKFSGRSTNYRNYAILWWRWSRWQSHRSSRRWQTNGSYHWLQSTWRALEKRNRSLLGNLQAPQKTRNLWNWWILWSRWGDKSHQRMSRALQKRVRSKTWCIKLLRIQKNCQKKTAVFLFL